MSALSSARPAAARSAVPHLQLYTPPEPGREHMDLHTVNGDYCGYALIQDESQSSDAPFEGRIDILALDTPPCPAGVKPSDCAHRKAATITCRKKSDSMQGMPREDGKFLQSLTIDTPDGYTLNLTTPQFSRHDLFNTHRDHGFVYTLGSTIAGNPDASHLQLQEWIMRSAEHCRPQTSVELSDVHAATIGKYLG